MHGLKDRSISYSRLLELAAHTARARVGYLPPASTAENSVLIVPPWFRVRYVRMARLRRAGGNVGTAEKVTSGHSARVKQSGK